MPFAKRIVEPQLLCRLPIPNDEGSLNIEDLCSINNVVLSRTLRQLSDLAKHACSLFQELENEIMSTNQRVWVLQNKIGKIQQNASGLDPKKEAVPVSNLDVESKLTVHYQAPWHQHHNVFHPCSRPPCVEELHRHAKQSLRALHRDQKQRQRSNSRERRVTISISGAPPMPTLPSPRTLRRHEQRGRHSRAQARPEREIEYQLRKERHMRETDIQTIQRKERPGREVHCHTIQRKAATTTDPDAEPAVGHRSTGAVPNPPSTLDKQTNWSKALPLPTPQERMKSDPAVVSSCIIPINVTGVGFDREASVRCSLVHSQSVLQRRRKLRRRKTITGIPRQVQQDMDSDESPVARERTVMVHTNPHLSLCQEELSLRGGHTKDSGCQTDDCLIGGGGAPSRRRIRAQRGGQGGIPTSLSHSTGNISSLPDHPDASMYTASGSRLRSRSLPREGGRIRDEDQDDSDEDEDDDDDDDDEDEELSPYETEDFLPGTGPRMLKDEEESTDDQAMPELQLGSLKRIQQGDGGSPEHMWMERGRSRLPRQVDMGSCEISSSSDTFSSPIHSVSTTGVLRGQIDHKEDHQSSSGNWSGSSSTCPSQTSETLPPAASPPLTGSSHCDSELSLNAAPHAIDDLTGFIIDPYHSDQPQGQGHRSSSFTSSATDQLDDAGVSTASEGEWTYPQDQADQDQLCSQDFSPRRSSRGDQTRIDTSISTYDGFSDRAPPTAAADSQGFYSSSMHFDSMQGQSYRSYMYNYAAVGSGADCDQGNTVGATPGEGEGMAGYPPQSSDYRGATLTLGRPCRPLKKPKVKPPPPKRSSSLKETCSAGAPENVPPEQGDEQGDQDQPKIHSSGQTQTLNLPMSSRDREMRLQLDMASPGEVENPGLEAETVGVGGGGAWGIGSPRSPRTVEMTEPTSFGSTDTHSFKDEGAVQSDYADLWFLNDLKSQNNLDPNSSLSNSSTATGTTVIECIKSPVDSSSSPRGETQALMHSAGSGSSSSRPTSPPLPPGDGDFKLGSPEKLAGLASPSSGYSSQSETPTSSIPLAFFPGPLSPTSGKRKPKVPERKSSLSSLQHQAQAQFSSSASGSSSSCSSSSSSSSRKDYDFPAPPTELDLSSLHSAHSSRPLPTLAHRTHMHTLHQNKQRAAAAAEARATAGNTAAANANASAKASANASANSNANASANASATPSGFIYGSTLTPEAPLAANPMALAITPTVLRSVQLRSTGHRATDGSQPQARGQAQGAQGQEPPPPPQAWAHEASGAPATRPKMPSVTIVTPHSDTNTRPLPPRRPIAQKPPPPPTQDPHHPSQEHHHHSVPQPQHHPTPMQHPDGPPPYESLARHRQDRYSPGTFWAMTAFRTRPAEPLEPEEPTHRAPPPTPEPVIPTTHPECHVLGERTEDEEDEEEEEHDREISRVMSHSQGLIREYREYHQRDHPREPPTYETLEESHSYQSQSHYHSQSQTHSCHSQMVQRWDLGPSSSPDKVPGVTVEASHPYSISHVIDLRGRGGEDRYEMTSSGVPTRSASQDNSRDDSTTPDTEDYFSKESTSPSDNSLSPLTDETTKPDDDVVFMSPSKSRTTEDLFAMIHRSKRKVLGRKDSGELSGKSRLCPPPAAVVPPAAILPAIPPPPPLIIPPAPALSTLTAAGTQRTPGPIYRSAKKSSTSNEEFKLLLLKKGSRTDSSYRMSATEILKSPIAPKSPGHPLAAEGQVRYPTEDPPFPLQEPSLQVAGEQLFPPSLFPRPSSDSFSPKTPPTSASSRQGRSRIPPAANSSRYSTRSRLYTAPMQVISEGETENSDGSPHDDRSS
ncbi:Nance-Horan syndrome protein isoform X4 [Salmo salar]|uniref:Nance-Horan syndrome protein isoform X4 n=1 Tax=Salmo salar TaxID=8030 RepID=A0ABM3D628_SALSA|nr:Nance-Horan syndrome protein-like isoform X4 [Salmo salar]